MNIGIDIDDTVSKTAEIMIGYANIFNIEVVKKEIKQNNLGAILDHKYLDALYNWTKDEKKEFIEKYYKNILKEVRVKEYASEILRKLKQEENQIYFITARITGIKNTDTIKLTEEWLKKNDIPYDEIIFDAQDKLAVCKEKKIDVFIDDSLENCKMVQQENRISFLMDSIMNRNIDDNTIKRVHNWKEVYENIKEICLV